MSLLLSLSAEVLDIILPDLANCDKELTPDFY
jgi:hypothetical protein